MPPLLNPLKKSFLLNAVLTVVNLGFPALTLWLGARILGPQELGKYQFANSLASHFLVLAGMGLPLYGAREVARRFGRSTGSTTLFTELFLLNTLFTILASGGYFLLLGLFPSIQAGGVGPWMGIMVLANLMYSDFIPQGRQDYVPLLIRSVVPKILALVGLFILVRGPEDLLVYTVLIVSSILLQNIIGLWHSRREFRLPSSLKDLLRHLRPLAWVSSSILVANLYLNLDSFLVGLQAPTQAVAWYTTASRGIRLFTAALASLGTVFLAGNAILLAAGNHADTHRQALVSLRLTTLMAVPIMAIVYMWSDVFVLTLFGEAFKPCAETLRIIAPTLLLTSLNQSLGTQLLFPAGKERKLFWVSVFAAFFGIGLNLLLTPRYWHIGAAIAALSAETVAFAFILWHAREYRAFLKPTLKTLSVSSLAALGAFILPAMAWMHLGYTENMTFVLPVLALGLFLYSGVTIIFKEPLALQISLWLREKAKSLFSR